MKTPKKIFLTGLQGAGKTTLATELANHLGIKVYHTDAIIYDSNWKMHPVERIHDQFEKIVSEKSWIFDGCLYEDAKLVGPTADLCIFIESGRIRSYFNILKRRLLHLTKDRSGIPKGCNNKIYYSLIAKVWNRSKEAEQRRKSKIQEMYPKLEFITIKKINNKSFAALTQQLKSGNQI